MDKEKLATLVGTEAQIRRAEMVRPQIIGRLGEYIADTKARLERSEARLETVNWKEWHGTPKAEIKKNITRSKKQVERWEHNLLKMQEEPSARWWIKHRTVHKNDLPELLESFSHTTI